MLQMDQQDHPMLLRARQQQVQKDPRSQQLLQVRMDQSVLLLLLLVLGCQMQQVRRDRAALLLLVVRQQQRELVHHPDR